MKMWNINHKLMCRNHLLGEHLEMHMFASNLIKGKNIKGFIEMQLVETGKIKKRYDELVKEIKKRGYSHKTPLIKNPVKFKAGYVNINDIILMN